MPTNIVFPPSSAPGTRPQESGGRLINAFAEKTLVGAPSTVIHRRSAGLQKYNELAFGEHTRGFLDINDTEIIWVVNDFAYRMNSSFFITTLGSLSGVDPVTFGRNNAVTNDFVVVTAAGCFSLFEASAPVPYPDPNLPPGPTSVCDYDGYFVWSFKNGRIYASDLNSTTVNALSFTTEQGLNVLRVVRYAGRLYAFGDKWTGVYHDSGDTPFPFTREATIPRGIIGTHAVAGWETGWANTLIWVGDDYIVYRLDGYTPVAISNDDVSRSIQKAITSDPEARGFIQAFVYMLGKNAFWVLTAEQDFTWEYNLSTGEWNERQSFNRNDWKGMKSIRKFDTWLIGDEYTGELYSINATHFLDGLDPLIWQVDSGALHNFPRGMLINRASFHITSGVGTWSTVPDPQVEISWSLDGGHTYGMPVLRKLGGAGETKSHPYVLNCGISRGQGIRYRLRVSDAVHVGLSGGSVEGGAIGFSG